jgi:hypothetical protein
VHRGRLYDYYALTYCLREPSIWIYQRQQFGGAIYWAPETMIIKSIVWCEGQQCLLFVVFNLQWSLTRWINKFWMTISAFRTLAVRQYHPVDRRLSSFNENIFAFWAMWWYLSAQMWPFNRSVRILTLVNECYRLSALKY